MFALKIYYINKTPTQTPPLMICADDSLVLYCNFKGSTNFILIDMASTFNPLGSLSMICAEQVLLFLFGSLKVTPLVELDCPHP